MKPSILITVEGGLIQSFIASEDMDITIVDNDIPKVGEGPGISQHEPDTICKKGEFYLEYTDESDPREMEIHHELKSRKV